MPPSINTSQSDRDNHVRSEDFLAVEKHPHITFQSTGVRKEGDEYLHRWQPDHQGSHPPGHPVPGDQRLRRDAYGGTRAGFSAKGEISRKDFGVSFNGVIPAPTAPCRDKVNLDLEVEGVFSRPSNTTPSLLYL